MGMLRIWPVAAVVLGATSTAAMAADLIVDVPTPDQIMTSGWDGGYVGIQGGAYTSPALGIDVFVGGNLTVAELFLIGGEIGVGSVIPYHAFPGIGFDIYGTVRGGVIVGDSAVIYGLLGVENDFPGGLSYYAGAGVEVMVSEDMSIRGQGIIYNTGTLGVQVGALWHF